MHSIAGEGVLAAYWQHDPFVDFEIALESLGLRNEMNLQIVAGVQIELKERQIPASSEQAAVEVDEMLVVRFE